MQRFILTLLCTQVETKDFNVLIDEKSFFALPVKGEEEACKKLLAIMTTQLVAYYRWNYKLIAIDLSKQAKLKDPQQIIFIGKIEGQNNGMTMFFIIERSEEKTFKFFTKFCHNSINNGSTTNCKLIK